MDLLPNSIPAERKIDWNLSRTGARWLYIYCANCGKDGGRVLENEMDFAFYLCNSCAEKYGEIPNTMMVPDEVFFEKVKEAQIEKYGRILNPEEVAVELQDGSSFLSKLAKSAK